ncbi:MAG: nuclear transport factor 2 family protein [Actinobacteria bacterium]|nr:MAG: nuclear transport factor 2 family protein [Actinomycetota bacterium]
MSQANVELVKSVHPPSGTNLASLFRQDADSGRFERLASLLTADFEVVGGDLRGRRGLTMGGHGIEGLIAAWCDWLHPWETYWTQVEDFTDAGDDRVLVLVRDHGRLRGSDSEVENIGASVWSLREGKIARIEFHLNREEALKAVGLAE